MDLKGNTKKITADWPFSGALQHEIDHLDGFLYIQRQNKKSRWRTLHNLKRARRKEMINQRRIRRMKNAN
jgi:peptide deformylase